MLLHKAVLAAAVGSKTTASSYTVSTFPIATACGLGRATGDQEARASPSASFRAARAAVAGLTASCLLLRSAADSSSVTLGPASTTL